MPTEIRVHRRHRWTILVRYRVTQQQANYIAATPEPEIEVTNDAMLDVFGPRCLDCEFTMDTASHPKWCEVPERPLA